MEAEIQNLVSHDPFIDQGASKYEKIVARTHINLRVNQRRRRKYITICEGLPAELNCNKVLRALKRNFSCNGWVQETENKTQVIQLQGDYRTQLVDFFTETGLCLPENISVHGV